MFDILLSDKEEDTYICLNFLRIWRLASRKIRESQQDKDKGVIFNFITPDAFNLKPEQRSVSLNKLEKETDDENNDSNNNRKVMTCKIHNATDERMASIFIGIADFTKNDLVKDPEYKELMKFFKIEKTSGGEFTHDGINACHYDLIYISRTGSELFLGDEEFKEDHIINTKRLISEMAKIPQSSLIPTP